MAKKEVIKATEGQEVKKERKASAKEKAFRFIERCKRQNMTPCSFESVLTAYAAVGFIRYDELMEMTENYSNEFMASLTNGKEN